MGLLPKMQTEGEVCERGTDASFIGYAELLLEYDSHEQRIVLGILLNDWL